MKKHLLTLMLLWFLLVPVSGQIDFKGQISQLPSKKTDFEAVEIGDVTNDGLNDIVVGSGYYFDNLYDYCIFVYKQNPNGTLASPITLNYPISYPGLRDLELGDFNNDGLLDIALCYSSTLGIFYQLPAGGFSGINQYTSLNYNSGIKSGDLNNDGLTDIVGYENQTYKLFLQKPTGGFTVTSVASKALYCTKLDIKDMNGDNLNDIVKIYGSKIEIIYQKNGGSITKDSSVIIGSGSELDGMTTGDLNNDGRNDLAVVYGGNSGKQILYFQKTDGRMDTVNVKRLTTYDIPTSMNIADLNCDGFNEVVIGHSGWVKISVFSKSATVDYGTYSLFPALYDYTPFSMAVGDVNSDQKPDVVSVGQNATLLVQYNTTKPLVFDSIRNETVYLPLKRDTTVSETVSYIPIQDTVRLCKRNDYILRKTLQTYANEHYSGDSLSIRHGTLCSNFCDTIVKPFAFKKQYVLNSVSTNSVVNLDSLTTSSSKLYVDSYGSDETMYIHSNTCWNIHADVDWIKPMVKDSSGEAEITVKIDENRAALERTGIITLSGERVPPIQIPVYQYPSEPMVWSPASVAVLSDQVNDKAIIEITSNGSWEVITDTEWLSFDKTKGTVEDLLMIQGSPNETNEDRIGRIGFVCYGDMVKIIPVVQLKKGSAIMLSPMKLGLQDYPKTIQNKTLVQRKSKKNLLP